MELLFSIGWAVLFAAAIHLSVCTVFNCLKPNTYVPWHHIIKPSILWAIIIVFFYN